jgi:hypothetical protein
MRATARHATGRGPLDDRTPVNRTGNRLTEALVDACHASVQAPAVPSALSTVDAGAVGFR